MSEPYEFKPANYPVDVDALVKYRSSNQPQRTEEPEEPPVNMHVPDHKPENDTGYYMRISETYVDAVENYESRQSDVEYARAEWKAAKANGESEDTIRQLHDELGLAKQLRDEANAARKAAKKDYEKNHVDQKLDELGITYEGSYSYTSDKYNAEYYRDDDTYRVIDQDLLTRSGFDTETWARDNFDHYTDKETGDKLAFTKDQDGNKKIIKTSIDEEGNKTARFYSLSGDDE